MQIEDGESKDLKSPRKLLGKMQTLKGQKSKTNSNSTSPPPNELIVKKKTSIYDDPIVLNNFKIDDKSKAP